MGRSHTEQGSTLQSATRTGILTPPTPSALSPPVASRHMRFTMVSISHSGPELDRFILVCSAALGDLSAQTIAINATHHGGLTELDLHNLFGHLMSRATHLAVRELHPKKRPFLISRSTFAGSGRWTGHWVSKATPHIRAQSPRN